MFYFEKFVCGRLTKTKNSFGIAKPVFVVKEYFLD
jgi:hypothetical protein